MVRFRTLPALTLALTVLPHSAMAATPTLEQLQQQVEALAAEVEKQRQGSGSATGNGNTTLGGYGEAYFKRIDGAKDEFDTYRLVLFIGHTFDEKLRFGSEVEVEHAYVKDTDSDATCTVNDANSNGTLEPGEVTCGTASVKKSEGYLAIEQLFLEYKYAQKHRAYAGQLLVPVGILNETHEPDTFYGVFRAPVEREIIPGTWFETGVMFSGEIVEGLSYDAMIGSGLKGAANSAVKDMRQRGSKADGSDLAYTARLRYTGLAGTELGVSVQQQTDMAQGTIAAGDLDGTLVTAHAAYNNGPFALRALAAQWDINDALATAGRAEQAGWYVEPSFKVTETVGVFVRHSVWDNAGADVADSEWTEQSVGVNWWLHERAVVKADLQSRDDPNPANVDQDGFNLGIGFQF